jgi:hypothetical protein
MKAVTVRQIPPALARAIDHRARQMRTSVNKVVISLLEEATGLASRGGARVRHNDLDAFAGSWSRAEADAFDERLAQLRQVDHEIWR